MATPTARKEIDPSGSSRKKSATSLLPAFEPLSSSPGLPKSFLGKRSRAVFEEGRSLPTPLPTSSTLVPSSSPSKTVGRSAVKTTARKALSTVPTVLVKNDGSTTKLGRSSQSCDYQLSANRLVSRVHVEINYIPETGRLSREKIEIICTGWNGIKLSCQGKNYELKRGGAFYSDVRDAEIMLDVHENRLRLEWPERPHLGVASDEDEYASSPTKKMRSMRRHSTPPSPSPITNRKSKPFAVPSSPSPAFQDILPSSPPVPSYSDAPPVEIFIDPDTAELEGKDSTLDSEATTKKLSSSDRDSGHASSEAHQFSDNDEENDPIIHQFGPFGANLLPRMAAVQTGSSPLRPTMSKVPKLHHSEPVHPPESPKKAVVVVEELDLDVQRHVINQLAFSRLSSLPLSTILSHLPTEKQDISTSSLKQIVHETACIGEIAREGKDAAGKRLENEFYYIPEKDDDVYRKEAVVNDLRKPGMRACRKSHKQYYWKKPK